MGQVIFGPEAPGAEAPRNRIPSVPVGLLAVFFLVVGKVFSAAPGLMHTIWTISWAGFALCVLSLVAMGAQWAVRQRRATMRYRHAMKHAGEDEDGWRPMVWPHPTAYSPQFHRKAS